MNRISYSEYDGTSTERNSNELMGIFYLVFHHIRFILYYRFISKDSLKNEVFSSSHIDFTFSLKFIYYIYFVSSKKSRHIFDKFKNFDTESSDRKKMLFGSKDTLYKFISYMYWQSGNESELFHYQIAFFTVSWFGIEIWITLILVYSS